MLCSNWRISPFSVCQIIFWWLHYTFSTLSGFAPNLYSFTINIFSFACIYWFHLILPFSFFVNLIFKWLSVVAWLGWNSKLWAIHIFVQFTWYCRIVPYICLIIFNILLSLISFLLNLSKYFVLSNSYLYHLNFSIDLYYFSMQFFIFLRTNSLFSVFNFKLTAITADLAVLSNNQYFS